MKPGNNIVPGGTTRSGLITIGKGSGTGAGHSPDTFHRGMKTALKATQAKLGTVAPQSASGATQTMLNSPDTWGVTN